MSQQKSMLVISAHAADFVWRAGGAVALAASRGDMKVFPQVTDRLLMRNVIVTAVARADLGVVDQLAALGVATVHEAIGRAGYLGPGLRPIQDGTRSAGARSPRCAGPATTS